MANDSQGSSSSAPAKATGSDPFYQRFGLTIPEVYETALSFYRAEKKNLVLSYEQSNQLSAFYKQATHGSYSAERDSELGFFDFVGHDRRKAWEALGELSLSGAQAGFSQLLLKTAKKFEPVLIQTKRDKMRRQEDERRAKEAAERRAREEKERQEAEERRQLTLLKQQQELLREEEERRQQAYGQQQELLSKQQKDLAVRHSQLQTPASSTTDDSQQQSNGMSDEVDSAAPVPDKTKRAALSMWSRPNVKQFIADMRQDTATVFNVGRGDSMLVRVPVNKPGLSMFWEFATEDYDVGFGVKFEHLQKPPADDDESTTGDMSSPKSPKEDAVVDVLLPVERRNSHLEVICGSHRQDGVGNYILLFDNVFSYLRAKTVHLHVYQTE